MQLPVKTYITIFFSVLIKVNKLNIGYEYSSNYFCQAIKIHKCIFYRCRNLDIRDAILQLLNVIRADSKAVERHDRTTKETAAKILKGLEEMGRNAVNGRTFEKKIDNISTFLLRFPFQFILLFNIATACYF